MTSFRVISHDVQGDPARCSRCSRDARRVVVLPIEDRPGSTGQVIVVDGGTRWLGVCAYCVLDMARAFQVAEAQH